MATNNKSNNSNTNNSKNTFFRDAKGLPPTQQKPTMPTVKPPKETINKDKK